MLFLATLLLSQSIVVSASSLPEPAIDTVETFLGDNAYFNGYDVVPAIDFKGEWAYTAIGYEAANINQVSIEQNGVATFSTADITNFGDMKLVNFDAEGLFFKDTSDGAPINEALDAFNGSLFFKVFELTADSNLLTYLNHQVVLSAGTIIVGFGDGYLDNDFDDLILALKPVPVPAALFLFAPALLGFLGLRRKSSVAA